MLKVTVNFYLNAQRKNKNENAIYCYVRNQGSTLTLFTGERIEKKYWDSEKQKVKRSYPSSMELNNFLETYKERVQNICRSFNIDFPDGDFSQLCQIIKSHIENKSINFFEKLQEFINIKKPQNSKAFTTKYNTLLKHLQNFESERKNKIEFGTINTHFLESLKNYFITKELSMSYIKKLFEFFNTYLLWSFENGYIRNESFKKFKIRTPASESKLTLSIEEINLIQEVILEPRLDKARDLFLFQLYTGQRFDDVRNFKDIDVVNDVWIKKQGKTGTLVKIPLIAQALQILKKYNNTLPTLTNQKLNSYIKEVCQKAGIIELEDDNGQKVPKYQLVTTHTARRTSITRMIHTKANPLLVRLLSGHKSDEMVSKYHDTRDTEPLKKAMETALSI